MPPLAVEFSRDCARWISLAQAGDLILLAGAGIPRVARELSLSRREALYELAYLRIFLSWEIYLEETFRRLCCGYPATAGAPLTPLVAPAPFSTLQTADSAILAGSGFVSWADPTKVIRRSQKFMVGGPHEVVLGSAESRLRAFTNVRNRIAHPGAYARREFDHATVMLIGRRFKGSAPGRFLRAWATTSTPGTRMLEAIARELSGLAGQISS